ncbi:MAG: putative hydroxymethylpyrimidine transport system substrate-binding protein [Solirubrobacteraceae bacterium]|nr:putative hydroxymethylpyrimidine transport system substrate-binding protein [Solirubrobacteraceae bacterium]
MTRRVLSAVLTVVLAAGLVACGEKDEPGAGAATGPNERVDLLLDYLPNADHAGIYAAIGSGEFKTAALDVHPRTPSDPSLPLKLLAAGKTDLAISYEPELLLARAKGAKLVSIGALVQKSLTSIVSLGDKAIKQPADLAGKTVGTAGIPYQDAYLKTILGGAGVDVRKVKAVNVGFNLVPALVSRRVDAVLGMFWNVEGVQLARQDRKPEILRVDALGVPTYNELIIVAREQDVRSRGPLLRRFMRALARGHALLRANVDAGVDPLVKAEPDLDPALQRAQVKATLPVFFPLDGKRPFGFQDPNDWRRYAQWMADNALIPGTSAAQRAFTNEFLPGEGI